MKLYRFYHGILVLVLVLVPVLAFVLAFQGEKRDINNQKETTER